MSRAGHGLLGFVLQHSHLSVRMGYCKANVSLENCKGYYPITCAAAAEAIFP